MFVAGTVENSISHDAHYKLSTKSNLVFKGLFFALFPNHSTRAIIVKHTKLKSFLTLRESATFDNNYGELEDETIKTDQCMVLIYYEVRTCDESNLKDELHWVLC